MIRRSFRDERPQHEVTLSEGFWLADTECTQAVYKAVTGVNPSAFKGDDRPVETVSWNEVQAFLRRLNEKIPGLQARLPTEAQWEYAARAGTITSRYGELDAIAWYCGNASAARPIRFARSRRMHGACTTCSATSGSGVRTARRDRPMMRRDLGRPYSAEAVVDPVLAPTKQHS